MWGRATLKRNAKIALSGGRYWTAYAVCVIYSLIVDCFFVVITFLRPSSDTYESNQYADLVEVCWERFLFPFLLLIIFVILPLSVGVSRFFVRNCFGKTRFNTLFSPFHSSYSSTMGAMFTTTLFNFLWFFVLVIPGYIKTLEYSMVPFILSDNPSMPGTRARQISKVMTNGEKGAIFVLYLSFFGWYFLAVFAAFVFAVLCWPLNGLACVAIVSFVTAYQEATFAELYIFLRDRAIQNGLFQPAELNLVPPAL